MKITRRVWNPNHGSEALCRPIWWYLDNLAASMGFTEKDMPQTTLISARLRAPRAAAIAGIVFSILLVFLLWVFLASVYILIDNRRRSSPVAATP